MKESKLTPHRLFNCLIDNNSTQPSKNKCRKSSRTCRIEELENRDMLSATPWAVNYDTASVDTMYAMDYPEQIQTASMSPAAQNATIVQSNTAQDQSAMQALASQTSLDSTSAAAISDRNAAGVPKTVNGAIYTSVKGLKGLAPSKGVDLEQTDLNTITLQNLATFGASASKRTAFAEGDQLVLEIWAPKKGSAVHTNNKAVAYSAMSVELTYNGTQLDVTGVYAAQIANGQVESHETLNNDRVVVTTETIRISGLQAATKYTVYAQITKKDAAPTDLSGRGKVSATSASTAIYPAVKGIKTDTKGAGINSVTLDWDVASKDYAKHLGTSGSAGTISNGLTIEVWSPKMGKKNTSVAAHKIATLTWNGSKWDVANEFQQSPAGALPEQYDVRAENLFGQKQNSKNQEVGFVKISGLTQGLKYTFEVYAADSVTKTISAVVKVTGSTLKFTDPAFKVKTPATDLDTSRVVMTAAIDLGTGLKASDYLNVNVWKNASAAGTDADKLIAGVDIAPEIKNGRITNKHVITLAIQSKDGVSFAKNDQFFIQAVSSDGINVSNGKRTGKMKTPSAAASTSLTMPNITEFSTTQDTITVKWTENADADSYKVQWSTDGIDWKSTNTTITENTAVIDGLATHFSYFVRVQACPVTTDIAHRESVWWTSSAVTKPALTSVIQTTMWDIEVKWDIVDDAPLFSNYKVSVNDVFQTVTNDNLKIVDGVATFTYTVPYPPDGEAGLTTFEFVVTVVNGEDEFDLAPISAKWLASPTVTYPAQQSATSILVTWADVYNHPDNVTYSVSLYEDGILKETVPGLTATDKNDGYEFTGLTTGKTYTFQAVAIAVEDGYVSPASTYSTPNSVTLMDVSQPSAVRAVQIAPGAVEISWTGEIGLKYDLEIGGKTLTDVKPTQVDGMAYSSIVLLALSDVPYSYTITAYAGNDTQTFTGSIAIKNIAAPNDLAARQETGNTVTLIWSNDPNVAKYVVERSTDGTTWGTLASVAGSGSYTDNGSELTANTMYYYRVTAYVADADEAWHVVSNTSSVSLVDEEVGVKNLQVVQKSGELAAVITWDNIDDWSFYQVSIWDGETEYTYLLNANSLDTTEEESSDGEWFVPVAGKEYTITIAAFDNSFNDYEAEIVFTFEAVSTGTEHVIDFEFLADPDHALYLGAGNDAWPNNLAANGASAYDDALEFAKKLDGWNEETGEYFLDDLGFTCNISTMEYGGYTYYSWNGFALSTATDMQWASYQNEMTSVTGTGAKNSEGYGIVYGSGITLDIPEGVVLESIMVTNTVYSYGSMATDADSFVGGPLEAGDYQTLIVTGLDAEGIDIGTVEFDMIRWNGEVVADWNKLDLSGLSGASELKFSFDSNIVDNYGPTIPAYFAFDDIVYYTV